MSAFPLYCTPLFFRGLDLSYKNPPGVESWQAGISAGEQIFSTKFEKIKSIKTIDRSEEVCVWLLLFSRVSLIFFKFHQNFYHLFYRTIARFAVAGIPSTSVVSHLKLFWSHSTYINKYIFHTRFFLACPCFYAVMPRKSLLSGWILSWHRVSDTEDDSVWRLCRMWPSHKEVRGTWYRCSVRNNQLWLWVGKVKLLPEACGCKIHQWIC